MVVMGIVVVVVFGIVVVVVVVGIIVVVEGVVVVMFDRTSCWIEGTLLLEENE